MLFTTARSTSSNARAATEVSTSEILKFFGFSTISATVERRSLTFLSLIKPCFSRRINARPRFEGSFGTTILAPSFKSFTFLIVLE